MLNTRITLKIANLWKKTQTQSNKTQSQLQFSQQRKLF